jgi:peptide/nickel transport system permease protein
VQSLTDRALMVATTVALSISFLVYVIVGQYVFGFQLGWFPVQGWSDSTAARTCCTYAPLPVLLAVMVGVSAADAAVPQLLPRRAGPRLRAHRPRQGPDRGTVVLFKHVLRNAMIPILTNIGLACRASSSAAS